ncbi:MAG: indole-3-glycerol phosphate synthase TrpC [Chloroflexi bacterium]|nr:indole-3-glycerol phosphate synthase TrpC [Chloroflexota bacterium]
MSEQTTETGTILDRIVADKREELEQRLQQEPIEALKRRIVEHDPQWSLTQAILEGPRGPHSGGKRIQLIAEIKKASPSKGRLVSVLEHRAMARTYTIGGAAGISVVTERKHFMGEVQFMLDVRVSMKGYYPGGRPSILRKDFLFDPYHLWESRAYGADAVLLIVAILEDAQLRDLIGQARELEMESLVEVHDEAQVERALAAGADLIGINNRDLRTFEVDLATTERLRPLVPDDKVVISESGIATRADVERLASCGVHAVLVGEALIVSNDVRNKMRDFLI